MNKTLLRKYKNMIDGWGGWKLFQDLISTLKQIADKHQVSIANVAVRYILDKSAVGGVIVGAKLGVRNT
jgi:aryl-alcohol dehydrogenase-like predicted oxidoreductase